MLRLKVKNFAQTTLFAGISAAATSFELSDVSMFPAAPFRITIDAEILEVGAVDLGTKTFSQVTRGVEGTMATTHGAAAIVENRWTAGQYDEIAVEFDKYRLLGANNQAVNKVKATDIETDTRTVEFTYHATNGDLQTVVEKDGATVVKTTTYGYTGLNRDLSTVTVTAGGETWITTLTYDANGNIKTRTRAVA